MIEQLQIKNFKAFREQAFSIAPLTLLSGLNGSGKSSLFQVLLLLRQAFESGNLESDLIPLNGDYTHLGTAQDVLNESAAEERIEFGIKFSGKDLIDWVLTFEPSNDRVASAPLPKGFDKAGCLFTNGFTFLSADRITPQIYYGVPDQTSLSGRLGIHGEWTIHFLSEHGDQNISLEGVAHPSARSNQLTHQVEAWMGEVSPGVQLHLSPHSALDLIGLSYSFVARRDVSKQYRPTNVGFGVTYALPIVTAILSAKRGDLVLLESPEAHLHPRGQAKIAELFCLAAKNGVQVIIESHSDHVLNAVRVAVHSDVIPTEQVCLLYFRWDAQSEALGTTVQKIVLDGNGRIADWPDGFFDEFDKSLEVLLMPKKPNA